MNYHPKLKLPYRPAAWLAELLSFAGFLAILSVVYAAWHNLPPEIPRHFDISGQPDTWGERGTFNRMAITAVLMYAAPTVISRFPHLYNYPVSINGKSAPRRYRLARSCILWIMVEISWMFAYGLWGVYSVAHGQREGLSCALMLSMAAAMVGTLGIYIVAMYRNK